MDQKVKEQIENLVGKNEKPLEVPQVSNSIFDANKQNDNIDIKIKSVDDEIMKNMEEAKRKTAEYENSNTKQCKKCRAVKKLSEFGKTTKGAYRVACRDCDSKMPIKGLGDSKIKSVAEQPPKKQEEVISLEKEKEKVEEQQLPDLAKSMDKMVEEIGKMNKLDRKDLIEILQKYNKKLKKEDFEKMTNEELLKERDKALGSTIDYAQKLCGDDSEWSPEEQAFEFMKLAIDFIEKMPVLKYKYGIDLDGWCASVEKNKNINMKLIKAKLKQMPQLMVKMDPGIQLAIMVGASGASVAMANKKKKGSIIEYLPDEKKK